MREENEGKADTEIDLGEKAEKKTLGKVVRWMLM